MYRSSQFYQNIRSLLFTVVPLYTGYYFLLSDHSRDFFQSYQQMNSTSESLNLKQRVNQFYLNGEYKEAIRILEANGPVALESSELLFLWAQCKYHEGDIEEARKMIVSSFKPFQLTIDRVLQGYQKHPQELIPPHSQEKEERSDGERNDEISESTHSTTEFQITPHIGLNSLAQTDLSVPSLSQISDGIKNLSPRLSNEERYDIIDDIPDVRFHQPKNWSQITGNTVKYLYSLYDPEKQTHDPIWVHLYRDGIQVEKVKSSHPAYPGRGVFAKTKIPAGTIIGEYTGILQKDQTSTQTLNPFKFVKSLVQKKKFGDYSWNVGEGFVVDSTVAGNETRFINDYRGIEQTRNVEMVFRGNHAFYLAVRDIEPGQELLTDYGIKYWLGRGLYEGEDDTFF